MDSVPGKKRRESPTEVLFNAAKTGAAIVAQLCAVGVAEAAGNDLVRLSTVPAACVSDDQSEKTRRECVEGFPKQLEALASYVSKAENIQRDTPLFNPGVRPSEQCRTLSGWLGAQEKNMRTVAAYLEKFHAPWVKQKADQFKKSPQEIGVGKAIQGTKSALGDCGFLVTVAWTVMTSKGERLLRERGPVLGEVVRLLSGDLSAPPKAIDIQQRTEAAKALVALLEALRAGAR